MDGGAVSTRPGRRGAAITPSHGGPSAGDVCRAGPGRYASEPAGAVAIRGPDFQAHAAAGLVCDLQLRGEDVPGPVEWRHRQSRRRAPIQLLEDLLPGGFYPGAC